jgi:hypothetical protein
MNTTVFDVLMIDDDIDNYYALKNYSVEKNIVLQYARTLEEGMEILTNNSRILGVILDGKGIIKKNGYSSEASVSFVHESISRIKLLEEKSKKMYSLCVLTAWYDNLKDSLEPRGIKLFDKKKLALQKQLKDELFDFFVEGVNTSVEFYLRKKFETIFNLFDHKIISKDADNIFMNCCIAMEKANAVTADFNGIRQLFEMILKKINVLNKNLLPDSLMHKDGRPNLEWAIRYWDGKIISTDKKVIEPASDRKAPPHIIDCAFFLKEISNALSHDYPYPYSQFAFTAALFSWMEIFQWYAQKFNT